MISRILIYFCTKPVLLFIHSSIYFHARLFNMKPITLLVLLILLLTSYTAHCSWSYSVLRSVLSSFVTISTSFLEAMSSGIFMRILHSLLKMFSDSPTGGHFQRNVFHLVFFCVIVFHVSSDSFSFPDYSFLKEKRKSQFQIHPQTGV